MSTTNILLLTSFTLSQSTQARVVSDSEISTDWQGFQEIRFNTSLSIRADPPASTYELYPGWFFEQTGFEGIDIYDWGCWCYFEHKVLHGHGTPVNAVDELCRNMALAYRCSILDAESEPGSCSPWATEFIPFKSPIASNDDVLTTCQVKNQAYGACAIRNCVIQANFVISLTDLLAENDKAELLKAEYSHTNGGFDVNTCRGVSGTTAATPTTAPGENSDGEPQCCGDYPSRIPFHTGQGKMCCAGTIMHTTSC